jgi:S1-C subfamily serine protease
MRTIAPTLTILLVVSTSVGAKGPGRLAEVAALQKAVQQAIRDAEPSIACVLVSRSDGYKEFGFAPSGTPGELGSFLPPPSPPPPFARDPRQQQKIASLDLSSPDCVPQSYGSGVVIDAAKGLVLTQAHVVNKATKIYVRLTTGGTWANIHASDPRSDLAVLQLRPPLPRLQAIRIGDGGNLQKGTFVLSLANPFAAGFRDGSPSASWGIISNVRRRASGMLSETDRTRATLHHLGALVQTDLRLEPGCSGGALLNLDGELIGLTTSLAALSGSESPGGFAVPMDGGFRRIIEVLRRGEEVEYGFLGVYLQRDGGRTGRGVRLGEVMAGTPAERAGIKPYEIVVSINDDPVQDNDDLFLRTGMGLAGNKATLRVRSLEGRERICEVTLAKFQVPGTPIASKRPQPRCGLRVDYTSVLGGDFNKGIPEGVLIRDVVPGSPADRARIRPGAVIREVNGQRVLMPADFYREVDQSGGPVELTLNNDGKIERITLPRN